MNTLARSLIATSLALAAGYGFAQDAMKKTDGMDKGPTMAQCRNHMAMAKKDGMKKDADAMKMDATCGDMMKKDGMPAGAMKKDDGMMKHGGAASGAMSH